MWLVPGWCVKFMWVCSLTPPGAFLDLDPAEVKAAQAAAAASADYRLRVDLAADPGPPAAPAASYRRITLPASRAGADRVVEDGWHEAANEALL